MSTASILENFPIDVDSKINEGTLPCGIGYYILPVIRPRQSLELRLVVKAGSIGEEENQLGFAHFVEHLAFQGTKSFKRNELHYP